ncbi:unnamed protein product [Pieris brassicae]|uniref:Uncharacterized protein n=1 Tax=Pieris brassicae TaxID=7116 RepID=A0A9P0TKJ8_PIEBR|nr:unnamed protein product [Pieris brassicae]
MPVELTAVTLSCEGVFEGGFNPQPRELATLSQAKYLFPTRGGIEDNEYHVVLFLGCSLEHAEYIPYGVSLLREVRLDYPGVYLLWDALNDYP